MAVAKELVDAVERMQAKDEAAFAIFYEQTYSYVYAKAKYVMHDEEDALDLTQETYIQAYKGIGTLMDVNNVYAWLGGIVYRQGMRIFNKKKESLTGEEQDYLFEEMESGEATPEQVAEQQATVNIVKGMIDELPELQRVAVMAFYYDNMKIDEIAGMCNCSSNTIKSRLNYAKKFLKEKVEVHEKQNRYKLCSVSPAILLLAFKGLFAESEYKMSAQAVKGVYMASCNNLGIEAFPSTVVSGSTAVSAGAVAGTTAATAAKTGLGIKLGIAAVSLLTAGGITVAVAHNINSSAPKEPVTVVDQKIESEEQSTSEMQTEETQTGESQNEELYDESVLMEGLYQYGPYSISITNASVVDYKTATFDMELKYTNPDNGEEEVIIFTSLNKSEGIASIDGTSNLGNRWFGNLMFMRDNSIRFDGSEQNSAGEVWDIMWDGSAVILTKAAANGTIQDRMPEEGLYVANDGEYTLTISNVDSNSFQMKFEITYNGGARIDGIITDGDWVYLNHGIATFTGTSYWDSGMQGYLFVNADGSITLSYSTTYGAEDGSFEPILLKK